MVAGRPGLARSHPGGSIAVARSTAAQPGPGQPGNCDLQQAAPARRDRHAGPGGGRGGLVPRDRGRPARVVRPGRPGADDPRDLPAGAKEVEQDELRRGVDGDDAADERAAAGRVPAGGANGIAGAHRFQPGAGHGRQGSGRVPPQAPACAGAPAEDHGSADQGNAGNQGVRHHGADGREAHGRAVGRAARDRQGGGG